MRINGNKDNVTRVSSGVTVLLAPGDGRQRVIQLKHYNLTNWKAGTIEVSRKVNSNYRRHNRTKSTPVYYILVHTPFPEPTGRKRNPGLTIADEARSDRRRDKQRRQRIRWNNINNKVSKPECIQCRVRLGRPSIRLRYDYDTDNVTTDSRWLHPATDVNDNKYIYIGCFI